MLPQLTQWSHYNCLPVLSRSNPKRLILKCNKLRHCWKDRYRKNCWEKLCLNTAAGQPQWQQLLRSDLPSVTLTCRPGVLRGGDAACVAAYPPAFQQGTQGPQLTVRGCTPKSWGTAHSVDPTRFTDAQRRAIQIFGCLSLCRLCNTGGAFPWRCGQRQRARQIQLQQQQQQQCQEV